MPAPTAWRPLEEYPPFMRPIVQYMWEHRPPLNPSQFAARTGIRRQLLSAYLNSRAEARLAPEPEVVRRFARAMGRPTSELMALAGHGDQDDPFFDRVEAVGFVLAQLADSQAGEHISAEDARTCRRVLEGLLEREEGTVRALQRARTSPAHPGAKQEPGMQLLEEVKRDGESEAAQETR
jgi:transcriptional regulator with XRE-family HTH domain